MLKLLVFTIFLVSSPTFGLLETLFKTENDCYSGCHSNYMTIRSYVHACKRGCDYKLHNEDCAGQCKELSSDLQIQASCVVGCSMSHTEIEKPIEDEHRPSMILIHIHQRPFQDEPESFNDRLQRLIHDVRSEWHDLVRKQPNIPIWILVVFLLLSSAILWYMIVSLCRRTPKYQPLSVRAQEFVFDDTYEKEKIQPNEQDYEVKESLPIKVKLTNI